MVSAHIASIIGREDSLRQVIAAITSQVDKTYVSLNGYQVEPDWLHTIRNVECELLDNSLGDAARYLHFGEDEGYSFFCDDDLIYSPNYCRYMIHKYNQHKGCLITLHGKIYGRPIISSHRGIIKNYRCLGTVKGDHEVETGGTGVMLINTKDMKINIEDFLRPNMADIWVAKFAHEQNVKIMVIEHNANIVHYLPQATRIWRTRSREDIVYETNILNSFLK
uniref:Glycosyltransferase n=1 Tax=viral metagenome TaxID=1070528 RepID=A0A6M3IJ97_9ZZZZ